VGVVFAFGTGVGVEVPRVGPFKLKILPVASVWAALKLNFLRPVLISIKCGTCLGLAEKREIVMMGLCRNH